MPLTEEQVNEYLASNGSKCPVCESTNIHGYSNEACAGVVTQKCECYDCDALWEETSTLSDVYLLE